MIRSITKVVRLVITRNTIHLKRQKNIANTKRRLPRSMDIVQLGADQSKNIIEGMMSSTTEKEIVKEMSTCLTLRGSNQGNLCSQDTQAATITTTTVQEVRLHRTIHHKEGQDHHMVTVPLGSHTITTTSIRTIRSHTHTKTTIPCIEAIQGITEKEEVHPVHATETWSKPLHAIIRMQKQVDIIYHPHTTQTNSTRGIRNRTVPNPRADRTSIPSDKTA